MSNANSVAIALGIASLYAVTVGTLLYVISQQQNQGPGARPETYAPPTPQGKRRKKDRRRSITWNEEDEEFDSDEEDREEEKSRPSPSPKVKRRFAPPCSAVQSLYRGPTGHGDKTNAQR